MKKIFKNSMCLFGLALMLGGAGASAQSLNEAKAWYEAGQYAEAKPVMERYYKSQPSNGNYSLWYGKPVMERYYKSQPSNGNYSLCFQRFHGRSRTPPLRHPHPLAHAEGRRTRVRGR